MFSNVHTFHYFSGFHEINFCRKHHGSMERCWSCTASIEWRLEWVAVTTTKPSHILTTVRVRIKIRLNTHSTSKHWNLLNRTRSKQLIPLIPFVPMPYDWTSTPYRGVTSLADGEHVLVASYLQTRGVLSVVLFICEQQANGLTKLYEFTPHDPRCAWARHSKMRLQFPQPVEVGKLGMQWACSIKLDDEMTSKSATQMIFCL